MIKIVSLFLCIFFICKANGQNQVVLKNMAAALQRNLDNGYQSNYIINDIIWSFGNNSNTNNSLNKLIFETKVTADSAKIYLIKNTLQYYIENYKNDSIHNTYYTSLKNLDDSICDCLHRNKYYDNAELSNSIFSQCLRKYYKINSNYSTFLNNYYKGDNKIITKTEREAIIVLAKFCIEYRVYFINKIVKEALKL